MANDGVGAIEQVLMVATANTEKLKCNKSRNTNTGTIAQIQIQAQLHRSYKCSFFFIKTVEGQEEVDSFL